MVLYYVLEHTDSSTRGKEKGEYSHTCAALGSHGYMEQSALLHKQAIKLSALWVS